MPFSDVVGNAGNVTPEQIGATDVNVGIVCVVITIPIVVIVAQPPDGVNV